MIVKSLSLFIVFVLLQGCSHKRVNKSRSYFKNSKVLKKEIYLKNIDNEIKSLIKTGERVNSHNSLSESDFSSFEERAEELK